MLRKRATTLLCRHRSRLCSSLHYSKFSTAKARKSDSFLIYCNTQITFNGRNGNIKEAESIFNRMPRKSTVSWTAMLTVYGQNGLIEKAQKLFDEIPQRNTASYNAMITAYINNNCDVDKAYELFERMPHRNEVSYAAMVTGFVKSGMFDRAEVLYFSLPVKWRDPVCSNALISGYLRTGRFEEALRIFEGMVVRGVVSWSLIVDGYCKKGKVVEAREVFDKMPERNVVTWTTMINGYMKSECFKEGFGLFLSMRKGVVMVNSTTLTIMFEACGNFCRYWEGMQVHALVLHLGFDFDVFLGNSIIIMYCRFGFVHEADKMFWLINKKDVISWNALISGYVHNNEIEEAYRLFEIMPGKDMASWTIMIAGFSNKGNVERSIELFRRMPQQDDIVWTAVISGFLNNGEYEEAFHWFIEMLQKGIRPNQMTFSAVLSASASLATLNQGSQIHAHVVKMDMEFDLSIQNTLVSLYSKCGGLTDAYRIFTNIKAPNIVSYNTMITGFAQNGFGDEALKLFRKMENEGLEPNKVTFLGVLSACAHVGLVDDGLNCFKSMKSLYNIEPEPDHYACMVDILGRAGSLDDAIDLIHSMPVKPHAGVWGALLGASRMHLHLDFAELAARHLIELQPDSATPYVVLSSIYSILGKTKDMNQVRVAKKSKGIKKSPGCSWIIVKDKVHLFLAGEKCHMNLEEIEDILRTISKEIWELDCPRHDWFPLINVS
ncbi:pentatricopeptide repeat-containing protein At1g53600, mitochondrial-like [Mangifera indica]|uniref:pentatricopeptide repeat-containing protein At1g53600, mitochondrial-like n=1 Tax=Mangifera indica TaxID=29780 RepID=UPI001CFAB716|nr:pentatricopeptide repeat-containing protein At1g53600, mitochondrial-like [Mangifera indica]